MISRSKNFCKTAIFTAAMLASGCASVAVSNEAIEQRTAFALGIDRSEFTISNRVDEGVRSSYNVKTNSGKSYNCYVGGSISVIGRVVSDAICNEVGKTAGSSAAVSGSGCNALLQAAGRC